MKRTIKEWRVHRGYTQKEIASLMQVRPATVSNWEKNPKSMKVEYVEMLSKILGTKMENIIFLPSNRNLPSNLKKEDKTV